MAISYLSSMSIDGTLTLTVNADADSTYTGIVVSESGLLKYRTKAQIKSDIGAGSGTVTGTGTAKNLTMWATGGTGIEDSPIKTVTTNTLNQIVVEDGERLIIDKPSSVTSGDPAFNISQDGSSKVEFGWDDDGDGFGFMYNYAGNGLKLGAAGNNPMIEVVTTSGSESVNLHKQLELKDYGSGTYTGTSAYYLIADSSGNIIEKTPAEVKTDIGAGNETLAQVLSNGNTTGGTDISVTNGDKIQLSSSGTSPVSPTIQFNNTNFKIFYDITASPANSVIQHENQNGNLLLRADSIKLTSGGGTNDKTYIVCEDDAAVELYYDNSKKLETEDTGVTITGTLYADSVSATGAVEGGTVGSTTQDSANIFKGSVISSPSTNALGLILRNSSDNAIIGSLLRTSASTSELTTDTLSLPGTTSQYIRGDGSVATFPTIPSGGVSGSGTSGKVAKFTGSTSIGDGDITFGTNTITLGDPTSSSTATLFVDTQNRRVGYRTITPTSAFEVVGTINTQGLNCNEQQFFVDKDNTYIKAGAYGGGEFFGITGSENQPKYTYAAGSSGKFVEHNRIETIKIEGAGFYNWFTNGVVLIPAQGTNTLIIVKDIIVWKSTGTNPNMGAVYWGWCEAASPTSNCQMFGNNRSYDFWGKMPQDIASRDGTWLWQAQRPYDQHGNEATDVSSRLNRPFVMRNSSGGQVTSGTFNAPWYIQVTYQNINYIAGLQNNADRTITSTGSGQNSRTAFLGSSVTNFSSICPGSPNTAPAVNQSYHFDNTSGCNGNNGYPASGDKVYTSATGTTVASAGYIFLYSGGGSRYYIQIGASGVVQGSSCTDSVNECDQPDP